MPALITLLPQILALIPSITTGFTAFINWIASLRTALKQSGEWTPEMEEAFINGLIQRARTDPAYQPDAAASVAAPQG